MNNNTGIVLLITSFMCFLVSWVGFVWMLSSSSLAAVDCDFEFSSLHEEFRCKQPHIAIVVWVTSGVLCLWLAGKGLKILRNSKNDRTKE
jgi:hypothetical protein